MQADQIPPLLLQRLGLRIGPNMAQYISESFNGNPSAPLPIIAGDARTGIARRQSLDPAHLLTPNPQLPTEAL
jgi:hypothetical protein